MKRFITGHHRVAIITTVLITLVMLLVLPLALHVVKTIVDVPKPIMDFTGEWKVCFEKGDCVSTVV